MILSNRNNLLTSLHCLHIVTYDYIFVQRFEHLNEIGLYKLNIIFIIKSEPYLQNTSRSGPAIHCYSNFSRRDKGRRHRGPPGGTRPPRGTPGATSSDYPAQSSGCCPHEHSVEKQRKSLKYYR